VVHPDLHVCAVLDQQVVFDAGPERVPGDDHPAGVVEVDVHVRVADDVSGDRDVPVALFVGPLEGRGRPLHADVRRARHTPGVLVRVPGDRPFGVRATGAVDQHFGGWRLVLAVVRLDVAPAHLEVAHLAAEAHDPAAVVVADVAAGHVDLVQVDVVQEDADPAVLVDVTLRDQHVAVAGGQMDAVETAADQHAGERQLHGAAGLDAVGFLMVTDYFDAVDRGHPLFLPHVVFHAGRGGGAGVRADELERRPLAGHHHPGDRVPGDRGEPDLVEVDDHGLG